MKRADLKTSGSDSFRRISCSVATNLESILVDCFQKISACCFDSFGFALFDLVSSECAPQAARSMQRPTQPTVAITSQLFVAVLAFRFAALDQVAFESVAMNERIDTKSIDEEVWSVTTSLRRGEDDPDEDFEAFRSGQLHVVLKGV
jgi:hypothetical protein